MEKLRIIFMGTPEFAVASLENLLANGVQVVAVVTAPDKPQGRGQKLDYSPVKSCALKHNLPVLQPTNLKHPHFLETLKSYRADLQIVVAFRMLPEVVWNMPRYGTFNLHASLLPQYRGAAPINWAIINGEKETGVTTFFLQHEIDTGKIIFQEKETIHDTDTVGNLYERLMKKGADLVVKTTLAIQAGNYPQTEQSETSTLKSAPKIFKETCELNWNKPAQELVNFVRGLNPYPAAWVRLPGKAFKIYQLKIVEQSKKLSVGEINTDQKNYLHVGTANGIISIEELQPEGKRRMSIQEFFRGNKME
ncbi:MAG: methionyl-tRNA formyltransferase [Cyclobacteriaceae bacterium]|nr:methionyl-tRNA formyltransferase [Cytophagales bacterium]MCZ8327382.1 methionyl-tRNA formyltransferase [Cyclobacteriaceae bacterium]